MLGAMPYDRAMEERHLVEADRHIAEGEVRRARQLEIFKRLTAGGHDVTEAQRLWDSMTDVLVTVRAHRQLILLRLGQISN